MPTLNYYVDLGEYAFQTNHYNFGTTGLFTCVGIIADMGGGKVFCGHLQFNKWLKDEKKKFLKQLKLLLDPLIPDAGVNNIACTSAGKSYPTKWTIDYISQNYTNYDNNVDIDKSCIYMDANSDIQTALHKNVKTGTKVSGNLFEV